MSQPLPPPPSQPLVPPAETKVMELPLIDMGDDVDPWEFLAAREAAQRASIAAIFDRVLTALGGPDSDADDIPIPASMPNVCGRYSLS